MTPEQGEQAARALEIDPDRSNIIVCVGRKGSGKSEAARTIFESWPYDRVVIDVTGDARPHDPELIVYTAPFPAQLPDPEVEHGRGRVTVWARVNPQSPTYFEDQDDALNLALHPRHRNTLVWVDEYAQLATAAKIPPNLRLALQSSRHYHTSMLLCFPRPKYVPVITFQQADKILIYRLPNRDDREVLAKNMGYPFDRFERHYAATMRRDPHAFLLWDSNQGLLVGLPPLPLARTHGPRA